MSEINEGLATQDSTSELEQSEVLDTEESSSPGESVETTIAEGESEEISEELKKQIGKAAAAARRRAEAEAEVKIAELQKQLQETKSAIPPTFVPEGFIVDPLTGQMHDLQSDDGRLIQREQMREERKRKSVEQETYTKSAEEFTRRANVAKAKIEEAHGIYKDFGKAFDAVNSACTQTMGATLVDVENPAAIINFLGNHPEEVERIRKLPEHRQKVEMYKLEDRVQPKRKLVSKTPEPIEGIGASRNTGKVASTAQDKLDARREQLRAQQKR